jgi:hypothetical protein
MTVICAFRPEDSRGFRSDSGHPVVDPVQLLARFLARARLTAAGCKFGKILALLAFSKTKVDVRKIGGLREPSESPGA